MSSKPYDFSTLSGVIMLIVQKRKLTATLFLSIFLPLVFLKFFVFGSTEVEALISMNHALNHNLSRHLMTSLGDDPTLQSVVLESLSSETDDPLDKYLMEKFSQEFMSYQNVKAFEKTESLEDLGDVLVGKDKANGTKPLRLRTKNGGRAHDLLDKYIVFAQKRVAGSFTEKFSNQAKLNWIKLFRKEHLDVKKDIESKRIEVEVAKANGGKGSANISRGELIPKSKEMLERELLLLIDREKLLVKKNKEFATNLKGVGDNLREQLASSKAPPVSLLKPAYGPTLLSRIRAFILFAIILFVSLIASICSVVILEAIKQIIQTVKN